MPGATQSPPRVLRLGFLLAVVLGIGLPSHGAVAHAQPTGPGPLGPAGGPPGQRKEKKEGPAEEAPKDKEALQPIQRVPAIPSRLRRIQLFDLHGYMRMRGDYFHRLDLDLLSDLDPNDPPERPNKFFSPPAEIDEGDPLRLNDAACLNRLDERGVSPQRARTRCRRRNGFASANMRLRLNPILHVTDSVSVQSQIDVLDNVVLGSTPDAFAYDFPYAPINLFTRTQVPPASGVNSFTDSVVAKRAWGRIRFGWGLDVAFGRMPWSWGMGLVANGGEGYYRGEQADIIRYVDQDYGDSVDSLRLSFDFGKDRRRTYRVFASWDWAASGPTTEQVLGPEWASGGTIGQAFSIEKFDNVYQWSIGVERRDEPDMLERKLALGGPVVNFGLISWLRYQDVDAALGAPGFGDGLGTNPSYYAAGEGAPFPDPIDGGGAPLGNGEFDDEGRTGLNNYASVLVRRAAFIATPDVWFRVNWRTLRIELEAAANFGTFRLRDLSDDVVGLGGEQYFESLDSPIGGQNLDRQLILNGGYALEFKYGFFQDRFHIGFDHGFASGDSSSSLDYNYLNPLVENNADERLTNFRFNPAYNIDLLMFREILGTVSNAAYFKPWAAFYFFKHFSARVDVGYALAALRQATLGNRWSYGIELDGAVRYHDAREPIFFQMQYGVMFPLPAFNRLRSDGTREDARAVQTFQAQLGIKF